MKIVICDSDNLSKVSGYCDTIVLAAEKTMKDDGIDGTLNILFVDEAEIRRLNAQYRAQDCVTDVLSFPANDLDRPICEYEKAPTLETDPETEETVLGDIAVCTERAEEQAEQYGHSMLRELCYLTVHGTLHLMGYDHKLKEDERKMTKKAETVLYQLGINR